MPNKELTAEQTADLLATLNARFADHMNRHEGVKWEEVLAKLQTDTHKLWSLAQMEASGGEPDVIGQEPDTKEVLFCDCAPESPAGRRNLCYDEKALAARKDHKPQASAVEMAEAMGTALLTEAQYRRLQELEPFDTKTSSWIFTSEAIRSLGGALFCDRRYDHVFVYHNGAESYYSSRGFRAMLRV